MELSLDTDTIVLHIAGRDRPGITSTVTGVIASEPGATLVDIGQSALHGYLVLSAIVRLAPGSDALRKLLFAVAKLGLSLEVSAFEGGDVLASAPKITSLCVTLLGPLEDGAAIARTTAFLASRQLNIREISTLSEGALSGLELTVDLPPGADVSSSALRGLRGEILHLAGELGIDLAVQRDDLFRRNRRLVCLDVDSTFVQMEVIDELAKLAGAGEEVARITERAMRGELDFREALKARVATLAGLPMERALSLTEAIPLTPGAEQMVRMLKTLGFRIGLVSGGFDFFVDALKDRFGLDFAFANSLEVVGGRLTGRVIGAVVDAERKAQILRDVARLSGFRLEHTIAVGDGANDLLMLEEAGLGIAYRAKPRLQAVADISLNRTPLDALLTLMGMNAREIRSLS